MPADIFTIVRAGPGTLSTMPRPAGDAGLRADISALAALGVGALVSMLTPDEAARLGLSAEPAVAADHGLEFLNVPIFDFGLPDDDLTAASAWVRGLLHSGTHVVIHCRGGVGRSSILAGSVLVDEGMDSDEAWEAIEVARGRPVPDTPAQRAWLGARVSRM